VRAETTVSFHLIGLILQAQSTCKISALSSCSPRHSQKGDAPGVIAPKSSTNFRQIPYNRIRSREPVIMVMS
jgi:hypothetical protein